MLDISEVAPNFCQKKYDNPLLAILEVAPNSTVGADGCMGVPVVTSYVVVRTPLGGYHSTTPRMAKLIANVYSEEASVGFLYCGNILKVPSSLLETLMLVYMGDCFSPGTSVPCLHLSIDLVRISIHSKMVAVVIVIWVEGQINRRLSVGA